MYHQGLKLTLQDSQTREDRNIKLQKTDLQAQPHHYQHPLLHVKQLHQQQSTQKDFAHSTHEINLGFAAFLCGETECKSRIDMNNVTLLVSMKVSEPLLTTSQLQQYVKHGRRLVFNTLDCCLFGLHHSN
jgi:hypothetical protein